MNYDFQSIWNIELYNTGSMVLTLGNVVMALLLLLITSRISKFLAAIINNRFIARFVHDTDAQATYMQIVYAILFVLMVCISLTVAGIPLTIFTVVGGALAIGVGFGSQNIVNNFISGVILRLEKPIRIGDNIAIDNVSGKVIGITTRSTRIRNAENKIHIIPNSFFLEKMVLNSNFETTTYRTVLDFGVSYSADSKKVEEICYKLLSNSHSIAKNPLPAVFFNEFTETKLQFRLVFYINSTLYSIDEIKSNLRHQICEQFRDVGVDMSPPQVIVGPQLPV